jgi:hypothetical protein
MESIKAYILQMSNTYNTPEWMIIVGPLAFLLMVIFIIVLVVKILEPKHKQYRQDIFHGMIWKWKYRGNEIIGLWSYCPTCKEMLSVDDENCRGTKNLGDMISFFVCENCGGIEKGRIKGGDRKYSLSVIKRAILANIRLKNFDIYNKVS